MATKRKSAFAIYSESKPAELEPEKAHAGRKIVLAPSSMPKPSFKFNGGGITKTTKSKGNVNKNKYAKLKPEQLNESINLFNGKKTGKQSLPKKDLGKTSEIEAAGPTRPAMVNKPVSKKPAAVAKDTRQDDQVFDSDEEIFDSRQKALKLFKRLIHPVDSKDFFNNYWEKKPMLIKRHQPEYYKGWLSCKELDQILRNHPLEFNQNIDVTTYIDGVKQKHELEGRAYPSLVWDCFQQGCSIRLLNPQSYSKYIWNYLSFLQELFGTFVGANVYLTPAGTQGFAPHYDDIEAFVLQLEGKKRWRVYKPLSKDEVLPRFSSPNFTQEEIGEPIIDTVLQTGDILYFPRGFIHQANALDEIHSLHITVSCYQKNSWGDYLSKLLPGALEIAMKEDIEFRRGLPINSLMHNGIVYDKETPERASFRAKTHKLIKKLVNYAPIDSAMDQMAKNFIGDSMPPCLNQREKSHSVHGHGETWNEEKNRVDQIAEFEPDTSIKLIRRNCMRLVVEENSCLIYFNLDNGKVFQEKEPQFLEVETDSAPAVEFLIKKYPKFVSVEELPIKNQEDKIAFASCLYDKGLLVTGEPLECMYGDESDEEEDEEVIEAINADEIASEDDDEEYQEESENMMGSENSDEQENIDDDFNSVDYDNFSNDPKNVANEEDQEEDEEDEEFDEDQDESDDDDDDEAEEEDDEDSAN